MLLRAFCPSLVTKAHMSFMTYKSFKILRRRQKRKRRNIKNIKNSFRHFLFSAHFDRQISIFTCDLVVCHFIFFTKYFWRNYIHFMIHSSLFKQKFSCFFLTSFWNSPLIFFAPGAFFLYWYILYVQIKIIVDIL